MFATFSCTLRRLVPASAALLLPGKAILIRATLFRRCVTVHTDILRLPRKFGFSPWIFSAAINSSATLSANNNEWDAVLHYWFQEPKDNNELFKRWFSAGEEGRKQIEEKFGDLVHRARNGELKSWEESPYGALAVILVFDQFCRTLFKGTADSFSHDPRARELVRKFLPGGPFLYKDLSLLERFMLNIPLEHSEELEDQKSCYQLFEELVQDAKTDEEKMVAKSGLEYSRQHLEVIAKFGRFPKRNVALGRKNTPEEEEFLKDNPYDF